MPKTRLYRLKAFIYTLGGVSIHKTARVVTFEYYGNLQLTIGPDTYIGHDVLITGGACTVEIGSNCDIGHRVCIFGGTHELNMNEGHTAGEGYSNNIKIGNGVWIGSNSMILSGVTIGDKAVISAGSVIAQDVQSYEMVTTVSKLRITKLPRRGVLRF